MTELQTLSAIGLDANYSRDMPAITYIRNLELEVARLSRELSVGLAELRHEQVAIAASARRLDKWSREMRGSGYDARIVLTKKRRVARQAIVIE